MTDKADQGGNTRGKETLRTERERERKREREREG